MAIVSDIEIRLRADIARLQQDMTAARRTVDSGMASITEAAGRAKAALFGIGAGFGLQKLSELSDEYSKFTSQLRLATDGTKEYAKAYSDVKRIANDAQADLAATGVLYARITNGTKDLGISQQRVADIVETTNLALKVSGATSQESASAILQLSQAFGSGALRGEEFNAVNEAAPRLMKAIADGLGLPVGALKNLAAEGKITSQVLAQVLPQALGRLREEAAQVQTISGAFTVLKNNVLEFVGTTAQSSGAVTVLTRGIGLLSDNLSALAGIALTVVAVKTGTWLAEMASGAYQSVTANRALAASTVATAEANALAATQASLTANTYLAEARTSTLAAVGAEQLAFTTNTLIPAQARAAAAAEAQSVALLELTAAQRAASIGATAVSGVIAALGGPIGAIITVLGLAATAWSVYQSKQEEANAKAAENTEQSTIQIIGSLDRQNEKLRERIKLSQQNGLGQIAQGEDEGTARLAGLLKQINDLKAKGAALDSGDQVALITLEGIYGDLLKSVKSNKEAKDILAATGTAEKDLVAVREKLTGVSKDYNAELTKLQTALEKGAITLPTYVEAVKLLAVETFKNSTAGKTFTDSVEAQTAAIKRRAEIQSLLNSRMQEHIAFLKQSGQIDEQAATRKAAAADIKDLNDQIGAQQALLAITKTRQDSQKEQADIIGTIGALRTKINNREKKEEEDLFSLEQARYRLAVNNTADLIEAAQAESRTQRDATRDQQDELEALGLTGRQLAEVTAARLRDRAAALDRRAEIGIIQEVNDELRQQAEELRKQADIGLTRERVQEQQKFWGTVEQTAHDTFVSIGDGGASMWKRLRDTGKNLFFEWLYQMTLKKWIINIGASISGNSSVAGIAGGGTDWLSAGQKLYDGFSTGFENLSSSVADAVQVGMYKSGLSQNIASNSAGATAAGSAASIGVAWAAGAYLGKTLGDKISGGYGVTNNPKSFVTWNALLSPWGLGGGVMAGLVNRAFGMKAKEYSDTSTINGSFGAGGFSGTLNTPWTQKGGWFRSSRSGVDNAAVDAVQASTLSSAYAAITAASADYAKVLGLNADQIATRTQVLSIALTKDEAANQKAIAEFFGGVGDTIATELLPGVTAFQKEGETASGTLQRLAADFSAVDSILATMGADSATAFRAVGAASIQARERLITLAGGLDALVSQTQFYNDNLLTDAEKVAPVQKQLTQQLTALGYAGIDTADQFKGVIQSLISSGALATEEGAKQYAGLLALAPQFKMVADYAKTAAEALRAAEQALVDALRSTAQGAFDALQRAIDGRKKDLQTAFDKVMAGLQASVDAAAQRVSDLQSLSSALKGSGLPGTTMSRDTAQAQLATAIALARAGGVLPSADQVQGILSALGGDNADQFATLVDYQRDQLRTANSVEELSGLTDDQLSVAQQSLNALNKQKDLAQAAYDVQVAQLDGILTAAQAQLDAINGVDNSVLAVADAFATFAASITAALGNGAISGQSTVTDTTRIEALYESILGRTADAGGMQYYKDVLRAGASIENIAADIRNSDEYRSMHPPVVMDSGAQYGTMAGTSTDQQTLNAQMQTSLDRTAAAVEQLASQFNQVSGGGNSLLTEPANALG